MSLRVEVAPTRRLRFGWRAADISPPSSDEVTLVSVAQLTLLTVGVCDGLRYSGREAWVWPEPTGVDLDEEVVEPFRPFPVEAIVVHRVVEYHGPVFDDSLHPLGCVHGIMDGELRVEATYDPSQAISRQHLMFVETIGVV